MKHLLKTILFLIVIVILSGCSKNDTFENETFTIKFGTECGWCAGQEYITITSTKVEYIRNIPCGDDSGTINRIADLCSCDWNEITSSFNYSLFKTLEYSDCNVCADGCDEIIQITENEDTHELRFTVSDEVEGMENLRQLLSELMDEMREMD